VTYIAAELAKCPTTNPSSYRCRQVRDIETGMVYPSVADAANRLSLKTSYVYAHLSASGRVLLGDRVRFVYVGGKRKVATDDRP
jgi:hypothetical protein